MKSLRIKVSTHSRPKAAGSGSKYRFDFGYCFNTQPPEGGWGDGCSRLQVLNQVSTHSRPKAAGFQWPDGKRNGTGFQHTAARRRLGPAFVEVLEPFGAVSTHSRPKAAGLAAESAVIGTLGFNTQPPEGGWGGGTAEKLSCRRFQHTAARRRLGPIARHRKMGEIVSTHSRPKAAGLSAMMRI